jgi:hypothetical protein
VRYILRGGDPCDLAAAKEWAAHFMHEAFIERTHSIRRKTDGRDGESLRNRQ